MLDIYDVFYRDVRKAPQDPDSGPAPPSAHGPNVPPVDGGGLLGPLLGDLLGELLLEDDKTQGHASAARKVSPGVIDSSAGQCKSRFASSKEVTRIPFFGNHHHKVASQHFVGSGSTNTLSFSTTLSLPIKQNILRIYKNKRLDSMSTRGTCQNGISGQPLLTGNRTTRSSTKTATNTLTEGKSQSPNTKKSKPMTAGEQARQILTNHNCIIAEEQVSPEMLFKTFSRILDKFRTTLSEDLHVTLQAYSALLQESTTSERISKDVKMTRL